MDAFLQKSSPTTSASAHLTAGHPASASASASSTEMAGQPITPTPATAASASVATTTKDISSSDDEGLKAWQILTKSGPVTQATFLAWYATHNKKTTKKRAASTSTSKPAAKKQRVLPGADASESTTLTKGKRTALLKAITSSLKTNIKAKKTKWHKGDRDVKAGTAVMDANEFVALFPNVPMTKKGVTTSFSLTGEVIADTFGDLKLSVPTFSQPRSFQKGYKTGSQKVSLHSADGKYSTGTSTVTLKFSLSIAGGWGDEDGDY
mmetsp:Transcript_10713/g.23727  ORF Transcript_10713/g.23727 Transcript_10713/m.23727 type:complete len:265 (-) Transcript_10713:225-1019(-)